MQINKKKLWPHKKYMHQLYYKAGKCKFTFKHCNTSFNIWRCNLSHNTVLAAL